MKAAVLALLVAVALPSLAAAQGKTASEKKLTKSFLSHEYGGSIVVEIDGNLHVIPLKMKFESNGGLTVTSLHSGKVDRQTWRLDERAQKVAFFKKGRLDGVMMNFHVSGTSLSAELLPGGDALPKGTTMKLYLGRIKTGTRGKSSEKP